MTERHLLFTYGILKGEAGARPATVNGQLWDLGPFPAAVGIGSILYGQIQGEIIEVTDKDLARTDQIEGHPDHYERIETIAELPDGTMEKVYIYEYRRDLPERATLLLSGEWTSPYYRLGDRDGTQ